MSVSPLQLHCITKQLTLPVESTGERVHTWKATTVGTCTTHHGAVMR